MSYEHFLSDIVHSAPAALRRRRHLGGIAALCSQSHSYVFAATAVFQLASQSVSLTCACSATNHTVDNTGTGNKSLKYPSTAIVFAAFFGRIVYDSTFLRLLKRNTV